MNFCSEAIDRKRPMARSTLEALGHDREAERRMTDEFEAMDRAIMVEVADLWDIDTPAVENKPYMAKFEEMMDSWEEQLNTRMRSARDNDHS